MTNVIQLHAHRENQPVTRSVADRTAIVADLVTLAAAIRDAIERTVGLSGPSTLQLEHAAQHLVDALQQIEAASKVLTSDGDWAPF
jgi:hypothetical protein